AGPGTQPGARGRVPQIPAPLPHRAPEAPRKHPGRLRRRDTRLRQPGGRVDPLSMLAASSTSPHDITVLPLMSLTAGATPRPFQAPVAERDLEAEVIHCVGGVLSPCLLNVALHGLEEAAGV